MESNKAEELLTPAAVARMAHVTPQAVRLWADQNRIPFVRTSSGWRLFRRADVEHHLADRQHYGRSVGRRRG
jgi:DNA-binding transcriptional MerR regulator